MTSENTPKDPIDNRLESEKQRDAEIERLDSFFAALQPGVSLLIERLKPSWCAGLLEEITIQKDEEIGLDYFIETWGGEVLSVKIRGAGGKLTGSYKIPLASYPPLLLGEPLKRSSKKEIFGIGKEEKLESPSPSQSSVVVNPSNAVEKMVQAIPALIPLVTAWMQNAENRRKEEQQHRDTMMLQMMKMNANSGIGDITKIGAAMGQLQQIFKSNGGDGGGGEGMDGMEFIPQALDVLKMVLGPGQQKQAPMRLAPPPKGRPPVKSTVTNVTPIKPDTEQNTGQNLSQSLADLDPESAANTVMDALALMSPDKQTAALAHISGQYDSTMESGDGDDMEYDDEETRGVQ
jgi:hypothetical protein